MGVGTGAVPSLRTLSPPDSDYPSFYNVLSICRDQGDTDFLRWGVNNSRPAADRMRVDNTTSQSRNIPGYIPGSKVKGLPGNASW